MNTHISLILKTFLSLLGVVFSIIGFIIASFGSTYLYASLNFKELMFFMLFIIYYGLIYFWIIHYVKFRMNTLYSIIKNIVPIRKKERNTDILTKVTECDYSLSSHICMPFFLRWAFSTNLFFNQTKVQLYLKANRVSLSWS